MSGIVGIYNLDGRPVDRTLLAGLSATLAHRGPDGQRLWAQGAAGLASLLLKVTPEDAAESPSLMPAPDTVLVYDGRLDNRDELRALLKDGADLANDSPDTKFICAAYRAWGEAFPERLYGEFAIGLFDLSRQRLLLARDGVGVRPLYYWRNREVLLFASEIKALLAHPAVASRPNDDQLAAFLLGGSAENEDEQTFFDGIYSLPPGHTLTATVERLEKRQYWDFDPARQVRFKSFDGYAEAFRDAFGKAVAHHLRSAGPVAISVSGGLDSSAIYCEAMARTPPRGHGEIVGLSYFGAPGGPADEREFVREIERQYEVTIRQFPIPPAGFATGCEEEVWHVESPLLDMQWKASQERYTTARKFDCNVLLTGHWGDHLLSNQAYLVDLFHQGKWARIRRHLSECSRWNSDVAPEYYRRAFFHNLLRQSLPERLIPVLRRVRASVQAPPLTHNWYTDGFFSRKHGPASKQPQRRPGASAQSNAIYQLIRSPYHVLCMEWNNKLGALFGMQMGFPLLDRDLIAFLMGIPGEIQNWQGAHRGLLRTSMQSRVPAKILQRVWKGDGTALVNEGVARELPVIARYLQPDNLSAQFGYVKSDALTKELARVKESINGNSCEISWSIRKLVGLEAWLRVFFGDGDPNQPQPGTRKQAEYGTSSC